MSRIENIANELMKRAYDSDGRIPFHYTDRHGLTGDELNELNSILRQYGTFEGKLFEHWEWYELDDRGISFVKSGGFKEERQEKKHKKWSHWAVYLSVVTSALLLLKEIWPYLIRFLELISENLKQV